MIRLQRSHVPPTGIVSQARSYCAPRNNAPVPEWNVIAPKIQKRAMYDPATHRIGTVIPGPTGMFQKSLMRLPIPKLEATCKRYLDCVRPLVDDKSYQNTEKVVSEFQKGVGVRLQNELVTKDKQQSHTSYINEEWFKLYLSDRKPLPINYNPFLCVRNELPAHKPDPLEKAAMLIAILTQWYYRYRSNRVAPEVFFFSGPNHYSQKNWFLSLFQYLPAFARTPAIMAASKFHVFPLDMVQFHHAFATTRVPGENIDTIACYADENPTHVIVNFLGNQYAINVCASPEAAESVEQSAANVLRSLREIVESQKEIDPKNEVGVLTSENRTVWTKLRKQLVTDPSNAVSLHKIDSALFVFSLDWDDQVPGDLSKKSDVIHIARRQMCHSTNRWWDKSFSLIMSRSGTLGMNFEHSWGDGVAILRIIVDLYNQYVTNVQSYRSSIAQRTADNSSNWQHLRFNLTPELNQGIETARTRLVTEMNKVDYHVIVYPHLGKRDPILRSSMKPDPFVQLAFQLAWYRLYRTTVSTYESASTSAFLHGRTECIRSATIESKAFTIAMEDEKGRHSDASLYALLLRAAKKHAENSKDAKMGQGVDRHLFSLRQLARNMNMQEPDFFQDSSYNTFGSNMMSTSTLYSDALMMGGFGPVSPGYGIGYSVADDLILFSISSWKSPHGPSLGCEAFAQVLYQCVSDLHQLCLRNMPTEKK